MAVSREDVRHVAALARLSMSDERASELAAQLNTILGHMEALAKVDTSKLEPVIGVGAGSAPLADDSGPSIQIQRPLDEIAPAMREGFFVVPRLSTHETAEES